MPRSVHKAPCWALQGRAALPGEGGWGGLTVGLQACNTAHGLGPTQFSAKFLVTGILLFQNLQVILALLSLSLCLSLSLSFPRFFCFINNQVLKILPSKYFSKWPLLSTWLHWTSAVASFFTLLPSALQLLNMFSKVLYNLSLTWLSCHILHSAVCTFSSSTHAGLWSRMLSPNSCFSFEEI